MKEPSVLLGALEQRYEVGIGKTQALAPKGICLTFRRKGGLANTLIKENTRL